MSKSIVLMALAALLSGRAAAFAQSLPTQLKDVGFDQRLNEQVPLDLAFKDETGRDVKLADYFHGKPVILVLAYYRCPMLCTLVLNGVAQAMLDLDLKLGQDFQVVTVSFDPRETPQLAAEKKATYIARYGRPGAAQGWHFLTGEQAAIEKLTRAVGFRYTYDPINDQYAHASGIMVLTPDGKISKYFYDVRYNPRDLRLGLVEAAAGKIGSIVDQVLLFCFHYDPSVGKYGVAIMNFVRLGGVLTIFALLGGFWFLRRRERIKRINKDFKPEIFGSQLPSIGSPTQL